MREARRSICTPPHGSGRSARPAAMRHRQRPAGEWPCEDVALGHGTTAPLVRIGLGIELAEQPPLPGSSSAARWAISRSSARVAASRSINRRLPAAPFLVTTRVRDHRRRRPFRVAPPRPAALRRGPSSRMRGLVAWRLVDRAGCGRHGLSPGLWSSVVGLRAAPLRIRRVRGERPWRVRRWRGAGSLSEE